MNNKKEQLRTLKATISKYKERQTDQEAEVNNPFFFQAEISNTNLDSYYSRMDISTLQNFAEDARNGVMLQDSHDYRKLGYGQSFSAMFEENRVVAEFYTIPGIRFGGNHSFATTDDFIKAIETAIVRDVSVGFHGGREICDICGTNIWSWDCPHFPGREYIITNEDGEEEIVRATYTIYDARLAEVSVVFDGATPEAQIIKKATDLYDRQKISEKEVRGLERTYQVRILNVESSELNSELDPEKRDYFEILPTKDEQTEEQLSNSDDSNESDESDEQVDNTDSESEQNTESRTKPKRKNEVNKKMATTLRKIEENLEKLRNRVEATLGEEDTPEDAFEAIETLIDSFSTNLKKIEQLEQDIEEVRESEESYQESSNKYKKSSKEYQAEAETSSRVLSDLYKIQESLEEDFEEEVPEDLVEAITLLSEQYRSYKEVAETQTEQNRSLESQVEELEPLAKIGEKYREKAIKDALAKGNKAFGDDFDEEKREAMLRESSFEMIDELTAAWEEIASARFSTKKGGRKVRDIDDDEDEDDDDDGRYHHIPHNAYRS